MGEPDFFLFAVCPPAAFREPRACRVLRRQMYDLKGGGYTLVEVVPPLAPDETDAGNEIAHLLLSERLLPGDTPPEQRALFNVDVWEWRSDLSSLNDAQLSHSPRLVAFGAIYATRDEAARGARRYAASKLSKTPEAKARPAGEIQFIREQDGPPENILKSRWIEYFDRCPVVLRCYLAVARQGPNGPEFVCLCIRTKAQPDWELLSGSQKIFVDMFSTTASLDILFVTEEQESAVAAVCNPFYQIRD